MKLLKAGAIASVVLVLLLLALPVEDWAYRRLTAPDKAPYVRDNERILESLPMFPGAREVARDSYGYHGDNGDLGIFDRTIGYETGANYVVPDGTRWRQVIAFYVTHMRGWRRGEINFQDGIADFTRGKAYVAVDASELGMTGSDRRRIVGVSVDKLGAVQR